jgi:asparagine synthase (glutamine-hydrolysing)
MLRYLGIVWNDANPQQRETAQLIGSRLQKLYPAWHRDLSAPGMQVFCSGTAGELSRIHRLPGNAGVVIGTVFARNRDLLSNEANAPLSLGPTETAEILRSEGRWLIEHGWGDYVAFGHNAADQKKWVLKDPIGYLPCFRTVFRDVTIVFSRIGDCLDLQLQRFTVNDAFLHAHMVAGSSLHELPPLKEVLAVRRGECIEFKRGNGPYGTRKLYWEPLKFTQSDQLLEEPEHAARAMRSTVQAAISSWVKVHPSLLLRLSGGLDSSIVAGCLGNAPGKERFVAYTYFTPNGRSDERPWARMAVQQSGCEHVEYPISPSQMDLTMALSMEPSPEPSPLLSFLQRTTVEQTLATNSGATAVFNGDGGDSGFCSDSIAYAVPEYLQNHGLRPGAFRLASQVALLTERSSWSVLINAFRRLSKGEQTMPRERILAASRLVNGEIKEAFRVSTGLSHPWFKNERHVPWDKLRRLGMLIAVPEYYNVSASKDALVPEIISPLYAQPVMELLLRIPIYTHFHDGRDRGLARKAFAPDVPEPILRRLWKDRAPGFHDELLERHRAFLQETLLEGALVKSGLLDRALLEEALSAGPSKSQVYPGEIFRHLDTEMWARHWLPGTTRRHGLEAFG